MRSSSDRISSQRARSRVEMLMTLPPYMSVGLPTIPQRPGAVAMIKEASGQGTYPRLDLRTTAPESSRATQWGAS